MIQQVRHSSLEGALRFLCRSCSVGKIRAMNGTYQSLRGISWHRSSRVRTYNYILLLWLERERG